MHASTSTILAFVAAASAGLIPRQDAPDFDFRLRTIVTAHDLTPSVHNMAVSYEAISETQANLVLIPGSGQGPTFFRAGGDSINARGYPGLPGSGAINPGINVPDSGSGTVPNRAIVRLDKERFTQGIEYQGGKLEYEGGEWMACPISFLEPGNGNGTIVLSYAAAGQHTFADCALVDLQVQFSGTG